MHRISLRYLMFALWWVCGGTLLAQTSPFNGFCWQGAVPATVQGLKSTNKLQGIIPSCTITVYDTGTTNRATLFASPGGTPLANPFTGTVSGQFLFYAISTGSYDVVLTGGIPPNTYASPVTLVGWSVGGGGSSTLPCDYGITTAGVITCGAPMTLPGVSTGSVEIGSETGLGFVKYDAAAGGGALRIFGPDSMTATEDVTVPDSNYVAGAYCNDGAGNLSWGNCPPGTAGAITEIQAGAGLSGGGNSGSVILALENLSTTVNGQVCALGDSCTIPTGGLSGMTAGQVPVAATASTITSSVAASTTVNGETCALGSTCTIPTGSGSLSGMTAGQVAVAATASTVTSSVPASTTVNGQACALGGSCTVTATGGGTITGVTAGTGLSGGGTSGTVTLDMTNLGTAGTYGGDLVIPAISFDAQGRETAVTEYPVPSAFNPSNTVYIFACDSRCTVASTRTTTSSAVSMNGTTVTVTDTAHGYTNGQMIQFSTGISPACLLYYIAPVTVVDANHFTVSESYPSPNNTCTGSTTGTGGAIQDATNLYPNQASQRSYFKNHGTTYNFGVSGQTAAQLVTAYSTEIHPYTPAVVPGRLCYVFYQIGSQDVLSGTAAAAIEGNLTTLATNAITDGCTPVMTTLIPGHTVFGEWLHKFQTINTWLETQPWKYITFGKELPNPDDSNYFGPSESVDNHLKDAGAAIMADALNLAMSVKGSYRDASSAVTSGDIFHDLTGGKGLWLYDALLWAGGISQPGGAYGFVMDDAGATPVLGIKTNFSNSTDFVWTPSVGGHGLDPTLNSNGQFAFTTATGVFADPASATKDTCVSRVSAGVAAIGNCSAAGNAGGELDATVVKVGGVAITPVAPQYKTWSCQPGLGDGLNAITAGTYLQASCWNTTGVTVTLTGLSCFSDNSGSSSLNASGATMGALLTGAVTCSSSLAAGTQSANVLLTNGDHVNFTFVSDGTSKQTTFVLKGTY